ncbi:unnamed protein product [Darwinula stevensoni]|uniref:Uncharacterized protein n=1 Tax=Darwinula stevensoni TaxID=69355 RepID=A0A7R9A6W9_9CRUS|nr:unnamed protein product [Darwinula stevensoni]CAG0895901.1 unnamed protein product [Darwinula stevensoni]
MRRTEGYRTTREPATYRLCDPYDTYVGAPLEYLEGQQDKCDLFRSAAEAGRYDILKLYSAKGNLVNVSPRLEPNTPDQRYKLDVVAAYCNAEHYFLRTRVLSSIRVGIPVTTHSTSDGDASMQLDMIMLSFLLFLFPAHCDQSLACT